MPWSRIAIQVLWFLVGLIVLCGVIYLVIWVIEQFVTPIPPKIKQGIWVIVLLLAIIALLTTLLGGGGSLRFPSLKEESQVAPLPPYPPPPPPICKGPC